MYTKTTAFLNYVKTSMLAMATLAVLGNDCSEENVESSNLDQISSDSVVESNDVVESSDVVVSNNDVGRDSSDLNRATQNRCQDGILNGDEEQVDCGGSCDACIGYRCDLSVYCESDEEICLNGQCLLMSNVWELSADGLDYSSPSPEFGAENRIDGNRLAVAAPNDDSCSSVINGDVNNKNCPGAGAVFIFEREGEHWRRTAYIKSPFSDSGSNFGDKIALYGDTLAVFAAGEKRVYVFNYRDGEWVLFDWLEEEHSIYFKQIELTQNSLLVSYDAYFTAQELGIESNCLNGLDADFCNGVGYVDSFDLSGASFGQKTSFFPYVDSPDNSVVGYEFGQPFAIDTSGRHLVAFSGGDRGDCERYDERCSGASLTLYEHETESGWSRNGYFRLEVDHDGVHEPHFASSRTRLQFVEPMSEGGHTLELWVNVATLGNNGIPRDRTLFIFQHIDSTWQLQSQINLEKSFFNSNLTTLEQITVVNNSIVAAEPFYDGCATPVFESGPSTCMDAGRIIIMSRGVVTPDMSLASIEENTFGVLTELLDPESFRWHGAGGRMFGAHALVTQDYIIHRDRSSYHDTVKIYAVSIP